MKKILITGSSGQSGTAIAGLLNKKYEVIGVDLTQGPYTTAIGDLMDKAFVDKMVSGVDIVIHTAALHAPHVASRTRENFVDTNIKGTLYLLESSERNGVEKFVYTSTTSLYGASMEDNEAAVWITEEVPLRPRDIYDITKIAAEELCRDFFNKEKLRTVVLRVSRFWDEPLEAKVFYRMYRGVDVRDVADAHQLAVEKDLNEFHVFNISAQTIFSEDDVVDLKHNTRQILHRKIPSIFEYYKSNHWSMPPSIDRVYAIAKARALLGFDPKHNIEELLTQL